MSILMSILMPKLVPSMAQKRMFVNAMVWACREKRKLFAFRPSLPLLRQIGWIALLDMGVYWS